MPLRVDEVQQIDHRKRELKKKLYTELYERASTKVRQVADLGLHETWVQVPSFLIGFPSYDVDKAAQYVERQFINGVFFTQLYENGQLFVSWYPKTSKKKRSKTKSKEPENEFASLANLKKAADKYR
jgi:hypothetical protein